jgi:hypothetical protein
VRGEPNRVEERWVVPGLEHATAGEVRQIDLPLLAVVVAKPNPKLLERLHFNRANHDRVTSMIQNTPISSVGHFIDTIVEIRIPTA